MESILINLQKIGWKFYLCSIVEDTYRHRGLRKRLIETLRKKGIDDEAILEAMNNVPRHNFLDVAFDDWAYKDKPFSIGCDQTISQPYTVAMQTSLLDVKEGDKVLEIGTGSGYQACILSELGADVYTIERQKALYEKTKELLPKVGFKDIKIYFKDGYEGLPRHAPFDKILITAAAEEVPQALLQQLAVGGYLVVPIGDNRSQTMYRFYKKSEDKVTSESFGDYRFVPMLKGTEN